MNFGSFAASLFAALAVLPESVTPKQVLNFETLKTLIGKIPEAKSIAEALSKLTAAESRLIQGALLSLMGVSEGEAKALLGRAVYAESITVESYTEGPKKFVTVTFGTTNEYESAQKILSESGSGVGVVISNLSPETNRIVLEVLSPESMTLAQVSDSVTKLLRDNGINESKVRPAAKYGADHPCLVTVFRRTRDVRKLESMVKAFKEKLPNVEHVECLPRAKSAVFYLKRSAKAADESNFIRNALDTEGFKENYDILESLNAGFGECFKLGLPESEVAGVVDRLEADPTVRAVCVNEGSVLVGFKEGYSVGAARATCASLMEFAGMGGATPTPMTENELLEYLTGDGYYTFDRYYEFSTPAIARTFTNVARGQTGARVVDIRGNIVGIMGGNVEMQSREAHKLLGIEATYLDWEGYVQIDMPESAQRAVNRIAEGNLSLTELFSVLELANNEDGDELLEQAKFTRQYSPAVQGVSTGAMTLARVISKRLSEAAYISNGLSGTINLQVGVTPPTKLSDVSQALKKSSNMLDVHIYGNSVLVAVSGAAGVAGAFEDVQFALNKEKIVVESVRIKLREADDDGQPQGDVGVISPEAADGLTGSIPLTLKFIDAANATEMNPANAKEWADDMVAKGFASGASVSTSGSDVIVKFAAADRATIIGVWLPFKSSQFEIVDDNSGAAEVQAEANLASYGIESQAKKAWDSGTEQNRYTWLTQTSVADAQAGALSKMTFDQLPDTIKPRIVSRLGKPGAFTQTKPGFDVQEGVGGVTTKVLSVDAAKAMLKKYDRQEDQNNHTGNYLMLAQAYGTPEEVVRVTGIKKNRDSGKGVSYEDNQWMYVNINPYYKHLWNDAAVSESEAKERQKRMQEAAPKVLEANPLMSMALLFPSDGTGVSHAEAKKKAEAFIAKAEREVSWFKNVHNVPYPGRDGYMVQFEMMDDDAKSRRSLGQYLKQWGLSEAKIQETAAKITAAEESTDMTVAFYGVDSGQADRDAKRFVDLLKHESPLLVVEVDGPRKTPTSALAYFTVLQPKSGAIATTNRYLKTLGLDETNIESAKPRKISQANESGVVKNLNAVQKSLVKMFGVKVESILKAKPRELKALTKALRSRYEAKNLKEGAQLTGTAAPTTTVWVDFDSDGEFQKFRSFALKDKDVFSVSSLSGKTATFNVGLPLIPAKGLVSTLLRHAGLSDSRLKRMVKTPVNERAQIEFNKILETEMTAYLSGVNPNASQPLPITTQLGMGNAQPVQPMQQAPAPQMFVLPNGQVVPVEIVMQAVARVLSNLVVQLGGQVPAPAAPQTAPVVAVTPVAAPAPAAPPAAPAAEEPKPAAPAAGATQTNINAAAKDDASDKAAADSKADDAKADADKAKADADAKKAADDAKKAEADAAAKAEADAKAAAEEAEKKRKEAEAAIANAPTTTPAPAAA